MAGVRETAKGRLRSVGHALAGIAHAVRAEPNARIHLAATILVVLLGWWAGIGNADWRWLVVAIAIVWIAELLNTAVEHLCDLLSPEHNAAVGTAKDVAAGAVLLASAAAAVIGCLVFAPYLI